MSNMTTSKTTRRARRYKPVDVTKKLVVLFPDDENINTKLLVSNNETKDFENCLNEVVEYDEDSDGEIHPISFVTIPTETNTHPEIDKLDEVVIPTVKEWNEGFRIDNDNKNDMIIENNLSHYNYSCQHPKNINELNGKNTLKIETSFETKFHLYDKYDINCNDDIFIQLLNELSVSLSSSPPLLPQCSEYTPHSILMTIELYEEMISLLEHMLEWNYQYFSIYSTAYKSFQQYYDTQLLLQSTNQNTNTTNNTNNSQILKNIRDYLHSNMTYTTISDSIIPSHTESNTLINVRNRSTRGHPSHITTTTATSNSDIFTNIDKCEDYYKDVFTSETPMENPYLPSGRRKKYRRRRLQQQNDDHNNNNNNNSSSSSSSSSSIARNHHYPQSTSQGKNDRHTIKSMSISSSNEYKSNNGSSGSSSSQRVMVDKSVHNINDNKSISPMLISTMPTYSLHKSTSGTFSETSSVEVSPRDSHTDHRQYLQTIRYQKIQQLLPLECSIPVLYQLLSVDRLVRNNSQHQQQQTLGITIATTSTISEGDDNHIDRNPTTTDDVIQQKIGFGISSISILIEKLKIKGMISSDMDLLLIKLSSSAIQSSTILSNTQHTEQSTLPINLYICILIYYYWLYKRSLHSTSILRCFHRFGMTNWLRKTPIYLYHLPYGLPMISSTTHIKSRRSLTNNKYDNRYIESTSDQLYDDFIQNMSILNGDSDFSSLVNTAATSSSTIRNKTYVPQPISTSQLSSSSSSSENNILIVNPMQERLLMTGAALYGIGNWQEITTRFNSGLHRLPIRILGLHFSVLLRRREKGLPFVVNISIDSDVYKDYMSTVSAEERLVINTYDEEKVFKALCVRYLHEGVPMSLRATSTIRTLNKIIPKYLVYRDEYMHHLHCMYDPTLSPPYYNTSSTEKGDSMGSYIDFKPTHPIKVTRNGGSSSSNSKGDKYEKTVVSGSNGSHTVLQTRDDSHIYSVQYNDDETTGDDDDDSVIVGDESGKTGHIHVSMNETHPDNINSAVSLSLNETHISPSQMMLHKPIATRAIQSDPHEASRNKDFYTIPPPTDMSIPDTDKKHDQDITMNLSTQDHMNKQRMNTMTSSSSLKRKRLSTGPFCSLSQLGVSPRLSTSPLTVLPSVSQQSAGNGETIIQSNKDIQLTSTSTTTSNGIASSTERVYHNIFPIQEEARSIDQTINKNQSVVDLNHKSGRLTRSSYIHTQLQSEHQKLLNTTSATPMSTQTTTTPTVTTLFRKYPKRERKLKYTSFDEDMYGSSSQDES